MICLMCFPIWDTPNVISSCLNIPWNISTLYISVSYSHEYPHCILLLYWCFTNDFPIFGFVNHHYCKNMENPWESHFTIAIHIMFPVLVCPYYHIINHNQRSSTIIHRHSPLQSHYNPIIIRWLSHDIPHILSHLFVFWSGHSAPSPCQATLVDRPCRWTLRCAACCGATCCRDSGGSAMALWAMGWVNIVYTGYMSLGHWW